MQVHTVQSNQWISYAVTAAIVLVVLAIRMRSAGKMRRLRLETLWVVPALYLAITVATFAAMPPAGIVWGYAALGLIAGAALGWQRGRMMHIAVDPETHALNQRMSPAAMVFLVVLVLLRSGARALAEGGAVHLNIAVLTDVLIAFALGMFAAQRLEMYLRARRLLTEARSGSGRIT